MKALEDYMNYAFETYTSEGMLLNRIDGPGHLGTWLEDLFAAPDRLAVISAPYEKVAEAAGKERCWRTVMIALDTDGAEINGETIEAMEQLTGTKVDVLHIVGGGSQSKLLNQFAADSLGRKVVAGPVEATAIGNVQVQAIAMGQLKDLAELRTVVRTSFPVESYEPKADWQSARERFRRLA